MRISILLVAILLVNFSCKKDQKYTMEEINDRLIYQPGDTLKFLQTGINDTIKATVINTDIMDEYIPSTFGGGTEYQKISTNISLQSSDSTEYGSLEIHISSQHEENNITVNAYFSCFKTTTYVDFNGTATHTINGKTYTQVDEQGGVYFNKEFGVLKIASGCGSLELIP